MCFGCLGAKRVECNDMPWSWPTNNVHIAHFEALTMGHAVIMGRRTWESLPEKMRAAGGLPGRANIIVSTTTRDPKTQTHREVRQRSLQLAIDSCERIYERVFVIGGARLFAEALPLATTLELTLIGREYEGDVKFPHWRAFWDGSDVGTSTRICDVGQTYECVSRTPGTHPDLTFVTWRRV